MIPSAKNWPNLRMKKIKPFDKTRPQSSGLKIALFQPQIPQNTGNIVRTCCVTGCELILIPPLGFSISDRMLKRAGLDYWNEVKISLVEDFISFLETTDKQFYFFSSKATKLYTEISYKPSDILIFGSETSGLPEEYFHRWPERFVTLPMIRKSRCLNLSNCVAISIYEAWRQLEAFSDLTSDE